MKKFFLYTLIFLFNFILFTDIYAENEDIAQLRALEPYETIVTTYEELKSALSLNNGITTVYFGADINMQDTGINIHSSKTNVYISGLNPLEPSKTEPYTLTEYYSPPDVVNITNTINVNSIGVKSIILSDINITGKNYYGPIGVYEVSATDNLTVTYQRVNYTGPQIGHHRKGTCKFIDCNVTITGDNGGSPNQEFSEVKHLIFEGENTINSLTSNFSVFWQPYGGTFTLADDSSLYVTAMSLGSTFGVYYADGGKISISIGKGSVYSIQTNESINFPAQTVISSFTLSENSKFNLETSKSSSHPVMTVNGDITVKKDSEFHLKAESTSSSLLNLYGHFICEDPASVLLYNPNGRVIRSMSTSAKISVSAEQVNYWKTAGSGRFEDTPLYRWKKSDGTNFTFSGTIAIGTNGNINIISVNYENGDSDNGAEFSAGTFDMVSASVIAFGRHEIILYEVNENSDEISGKTSPGAPVRISYEADDNIFYEYDTTSDDSGFYNAPVETGKSVKPDSIVIARSKYRYLTAIASVPVNLAPKLEVSIPDKIFFKKAEVASYPQIIYRSDPDWMITISDTRQNGSSWKIYSKISSHLTIPGQNITLSGSIVFIDDRGDITPLKMTEPVLIYENVKTPGHDITGITWDYNKGISVYIPAGKGSPGIYSAVIEWIISDVP